MAARPRLHRPHAEVRDVLLSGGDPLTLSDERLDWLLSRLRAIPHVEFIRIGTKMPAVLPQRITPQLCRMLKRYHPLWMSIHFIHPDECTPETGPACARLADAGIPLGSQTVLLAGVNDNVETMKRADARPADDAGAAVLPVPVRPDLGLGALPHARVQGAGDHRGPARPHHRLRGAQLRDRRPRRRRQDPAAARLRRRTRRRRPAAAQLRGPGVPLPRSREVSAVALLFGRLPPHAGFDEQDVLVEAAAVSRALRELGHRSVQVPLTLDLRKAARKLARLAPPLRFQPGGIPGGEGPAGPPGPGPAGLPGNALHRMRDGSDLSHFQQAAHQGTAARGRNSHAGLDEGRP